MFDDLILPTKVVEFRRKIVALQDEIQKLPQIVVEPRHYFADGLYAREITLPAGTLAIGKIHKKEQINIITQGSLYIATENGVVHVNTPSAYIFTGLVGAKRAAYVLEETVWVTISPTNLKTLDGLEEELIAVEFSDDQVSLDSVDAFFHQQTSGG